MAVESRFSYDGYRAEASAAKCLIPRLCAPWALASRSDIREERTLRAASRSICVITKRIQPASLQAIYTHLPGSVSYQDLADLLRAAQATVLYGTALQMAIQAICLLCYTAPLPRGERHCAFFCLYIAATVPQVGLWDNTE